MNGPSRLIPRLNGARLSGIHFLEPMASLSLSLRNNRNNTGSCADRVRAGEDMG